MESSSINRYGTYVDLSHNQIRSHNYHGLMVGTYWRHLRGNKWRWRFSIYRLWTELDLCRDRLDGRVCLLPILRRRWPHVRGHMVSRVVYVFQSRDNLGGGHH